jgi:uncharacterized protein (DUF1778 family)
MEITIRLTDEQEKLLAEAMELTGEATKSKTVIYLIENAKKHIKERKELNEVNSDIDMMFFYLDKLKERKIPY